MPGAPEIGTQTTVTLPAPTESHTFLVKRGTRGSFQVSYYELSMQLAGDVIHSAEKLDCSSGLGGVWTKSAEHAQPLGAAQGYAVIATAPTSDSLPDGGYEEDRCFVIGRRMYHLIAVGPNTPAQQRDAGRFLSSFQLL
jgi:hypothetical protein